MQQINFTITDEEILDLLSVYDEKKRETMIYKALRIGLIALKDIETVGNIDYVEKEFEKFKNNLDKEFLVLKDDFSKKLKEADELIENKFSRNFDPKTGIMPQVMEKYLGEGGKLSDLFNENNNTSAVSKIKKIFSEYFDDEASTVARLLDPSNPKSPLHTFKNELSERLIAIEKEIRAKESAKDATRKEAEKGTQKGLEFEDLIFGEIEKIASILGDTCLPTGKEIGQILDSKLGDTVVIINSSQTGGATLKIVFEAKDKGMYLSTLLDELESSKKNRNAQYAVGILSGKNTLKDVNERIGTFRDYSNNKTICIFDKENYDSIALEVAYKLARTKLILGLRVHEMKTESIDIVVINTLTNEIIKKLGEFTTIKAMLTKATGAIGSAQTQIDNTKADLLGMLQELLEKAKPTSKK